MPQTSGIKLHVVNIWFEIKSHLKKCKKTAAFLSRESKLILKFTFFV